MKLTAYFGEDARVDGRLASDALLDYLEDNDVATAALLRGAEGFGHSHTLHAERFPDTAPKLPLVALAVDDRARLEPLLPGVAQLVGGGLVTLERAQMGEIRDVPPAAKLTVYLRRGDRVEGRPAREALVDLLRGHGLLAASVLLGVDGLLAGRRARATLLGRNDDPPLVAIAVGPGEAVASLLPEIATRLGEPQTTVERVQVCAHLGTILDEPEPLPDGSLQKLTVHAAATARHGGHPLALALVRRLREEGAPGATMLRSSWGYAGGEQPHGERVALVRRTPTVVVAIDRAEGIRRLWPAVAELTAEAGLVTSERVPGFSSAATGSTPT